MAKAKTGQGEAAESRAPNVANKAHCQFNHVQTFPRVISAMHAKDKKNPKTGKVRTIKKERKWWTVADIAAEANREEDHITHVDGPLPAVCVAGRPIAELPKIVDDMLKDAKQSNGKAIRKDTHVLLAAVYSLAIKKDDYLENKEYCDAFIKDAMEWHERTYSLEILNASLHLDEAYVHWHIFGCDKDARKHIPGWIAKEKMIDNCLKQGMNKEETNKYGNTAFKEAMSELQDNFWLEVGRFHGLDRFAETSRPRWGPGEKKAFVADRQKEDKLLRESRDKDLEKKKKLIAEAEEIDKKKAELVSAQKNAMDEANALIAAANKKAKEEAGEIKREAEEEAEKQARRLKSLIAGNACVAAEVVAENMQFKEEIKQTTKKLTAAEAMIQHLTEKMAVLQGKLNNAKNWLKVAVGQLEKHRDFSLSHLFKKKKSGGTAGGSAGDAGDGSGPVEIQKPMPAAAQKPVGGVVDEEEEKGGSGGKGSSPYDIPKPFEPAKPPSPWNKK